MHHCDSNGIGLLAYFFGFYLSVLWALVHLLWDALAVFLDESSLMDKHLPHLKVFVADEIKHFSLNFLIRLVAEDDWEQVHKGVDRIQGRSALKFLVNYVLEPVHLHRVDRVKIYQTACIVLVKLLELLFLWVLALRLLLNGPAIEFLLNLISVDLDFFFLLVRRLQVRVNLMSLSVKHALQSPCIVSEAVSLPRLFILLRAQDSFFVEEDSQAVPL